MIHSPILLRSITAKDNGSIDFSSDIRPIFKQHCAACHGGVKQAAELSFVYAESVGKFLEPGNPDASKLIQRIVDEDEDNRMPPASHGRRLSKEEVETIKRWVLSGARWESHWAYRIPRRSVIKTDLEPELANWCREPMDSLVLAGQREKSSRGR